MARKTFDVETIKNEVNELLANYHEKQVDPEYLLGQRQLLETILHRTGNYQGYQYLDTSKVPYGERVGCHFEWCGHDHRFTTVNGKIVDRAFDNTDSNRVRYY